jgi:hypothetical protein
MKNIVGLQYIKSDVLEHGFLCRYGLSVLYEVRINRIIAYVIMKYNINIKKHEHYNPNHLIFSILENNTRPQN